MKALIKFIILNFILGSCSLLNTTTIKKNVIKNSRTTINIAVNNLQLFELNITLTEDSVTKLSNSLTVSSFNTTLNKIIKTINKEIQLVLINSTNCLNLLLRNIRNKTLYLFNLNLHCLNMIDFTIFLNHTLKNNLIAEQSIGGIISTILNSYVFDVVTVAATYTQILIAKNLNGPILVTSLLCVIATEGVALPCDIIAATSTFHYLFQLINGEICLLPPPPEDCGQLNFCPTCCCPYHNDPCNNPICCLCP